ncbi:helix-turn-helix transcriptional regulator [Paludisphaera sp.]|uniref:helix-turn-helix domain-containing protein n=1 Tax=Paludisphaera sp. TaxID=2017432 RepID=UPI00301D36F2
MDRLERERPGVGPISCLGERVGLNFTYLSKIENGKLDFAGYPSEGTILKLAEALGEDPDELLLLAEKIPESIKRRVIERPDAFRVLAGLDDQTLDRLIKQIG